MKKKNGFTLIELLAVIIILGIIAVIATPLAINVIEDSKKNAFKNTAYGLIDAVKLQYAENYLNGNTNELFYTFPDTTGLSFSGESPDGGTIRLTENGKISLAIHNNKWCAVKGLDESDVSIRAYEEEKCILQEEADVPVISLNGKDIIYLGIGKTYTDPGYSVKTVGGEELDSNLVKVDITGQTTGKKEVDTSIVETYSITYSMTHKEKTDIKTRTVHVGNYDPTIIIEPNEINDYQKTLDITISVSAHENFTINGFTYTIIKDDVEVITETINELTKILTLNEDGIYKIKVSATDSEGNTSEFTSNEYKIDSSITEPNIVETDAPNNNGWYKSNIGITFTTDSDASEISEIKYCKTESTSCTPDTAITGSSGSTVIDNESATNYVCALSIDKAGNESAVKCAGPYALDKTSPSLTVPADTTIKVSEVASYDLLNGASASDGLSQLDGNITTSGSLSTEIKTHTITYTVTDKAGNTISKPRNITVKSDGISFTEKMQSSSSEVAALDPDGNLRYVGKNPNNYVRFNHELWRIIGVFDEKTKIIRKDYYNGTAMAWHGVYDGVYSNNWAKADLQKELNGIYLKSIQTNDPISYGYIELDHEWKLGGTGQNAYITRSEMYKAERGKNVYSGNPLTWIGAIGLIYPSDYAYSTSYAEGDCDKAYIGAVDSDNCWEYWPNCYRNSWFRDTQYYQWTITATTNSRSRVFTVARDDFIFYTEHDNDYIHMVKPVLYLKPEVKITGGKGTEDEPYTLGI